MKPNEKFTVKQMKDYIRTNSLNKRIKLTQKKADLISALKREGHWEGKATPKKATPKKATPKKATPKKATPKPTPKKATPKKATPNVAKSKETWKNWVARLKVDEDTSYDALFNEKTIPVVYHYDPDKKVFEVYFSITYSDGELYDTGYIGNVKKRKKSISVKDLNDLDKFQLQKAISTFKSANNVSTAGDNLLYLMVDKGEKGIKKEAGEEMQYYLNNI